MCESSSRNGWEMRDMGRGKEKKEEEEKKEARKGRKTNFISKAF